MSKNREQLGLVAELMCQSKVYRNQPLAFLRTWVMPAIEHDQIRFLFDHAGEPVAYWTWAFLAPDVEHRFIHDSHVLLHESEWNEGGQLWIMDLVALRGFIRSVIYHMNNSMLFDYSCAYSLRRNKGGIVRKVSLWNRKVDKNVVPPLARASPLLIMPDEYFSASRTDFLKQKGN